MAASRVLALCGLATLALECLATPSNDNVLTAQIANHQRRQGLSKRDTQIINISNQVNYSLYAINITIGTPPQPISLQLDTGSTDVWVVTPEACPGAITSTGIDLPQCGGTYDMSKSSSGAFAPGGEGQFTTGYLDTTGVQAGDFVRDTLSIGKWSLPDFTFGQATSLSALPAVCGMGFDDPSRTTPAILTSLLNAGMISTRSFSLWLDDLDESTGTIMFGGFDTEKVTGGQLTMLPMQANPDTNNIDSYIVTLSSIGVTLPGSNGGAVTSQVMTPDDFGVPALLDSGTSLGELPQNVFDMLTKAFGAVYDNNQQSWVVDCSLATTPGSLDFQFGGTTGPVIGVPFSELIIPLIGSDGFEVKNTKGRGMCQVGVTAQDGVETSFSQLIVGDTFLRSMYVFYDLDTQQIGIGQTAFAATGSSVQEVTSNTTLPSGAVNISSTIGTPTPLPTSAAASSTSEMSYASTPITETVPTTFDAAAFTGSSTSYSTSFPTVAGSPTARVGAELKGTPIAGEVINDASGVSVDWRWPFMVLAPMAGGTLLLW